MVHKLFRMSSFTTLIDLSPDTRVILMFHEAEEIIDKYEEIAYAKEMLDYGLEEDSSEDEQNESEEENILEEEIEEI